MRTDPYDFHQFSVDTTCNCDNLKVVYLFLQRITKEYGNKLGESSESLVKKLSDAFIEKPQWNPRGKFDLKFSLY